MSYLAYPGFVAAAWISGTVMSLAGLIWLALLVFDRSQSFGARLAIGTGLMMAFALPLSIAVMLIALPIANIYYEYQNLDLLKLQKEFAAGGVALRLTSIALGITCLYYLVQIGPAKKDDEATEESDEPEAAAPQPRASGRMKLFEGINLAPEHYFSRSYLQAGFYCCIIMFLWVYEMKGISNFSLAIASWGLFLVLDDWLLINSYSAMAGHRIRRIDRWRMALIDVVLVIACLFVLSVQWFWAGLLSIGTAMFLRGLKVIFK